MISYEDDTITLGSRTQTAETVARIAAGDDEYEVVTEEQSDQPEPEPVPAAEPVAEEAPAAEPVAKAEPEPAPEPEVAPAPAPEAAAIPPKPVEHKRGSYAWLKAERRRLEEENRKANEELQRYRQPGSAPAPAAAAPLKPEEKPIPAVVQPDPEPKPDDFELGAYDPGFIKALTTWQHRENRRQDQEAEQKRVREEATQKVQQEQDRAKSVLDADQKEISDRWERTRAEAREMYPDFDQVMSKSREVAPSTEVLMFAVLDQPNSGHVAYWLVKHDAEARRLAKLTDIPKNAAPWQQRQALSQAYAEIAKIQVQMVNEDEQPAAEGHEEELPPAEEPKVVPPKAPLQPKPGVQPPAPRAVAPKVPAPPARTPAPKEDPPPMVSGSRGSSRASLSAEALAHAEKGSQAEKQLREMSDEEYRKLMGMA